MPGRFGQILPYRAGQGAISRYRPYTQYAGAIYQTGRALYNVGRAYSGFKRGWGAISSVSNRIANVRKRARTVLDWLRAEKRAGYLKTSGSYYGGPSIYYNTGYRGKRSYRRYRKFR